MENDLNIVRERIKTYLLLLSTTNIPMDEYTDKLNKLDFKLLHLKEMYDEFLVSLMQKYAEIKAQYGKDTV